MPGQRELMKTGNLLETSLKSDGHSWSVKVDAILHTAKKKRTSYMEVICSYLCIVWGIGGGHTPYRH